MSFEQQQPRKTGTGLGVGVILFFIMGFIIFSVYTDEVNETISDIQTGAEIASTIKGFTDLLPLSLANVAVEGDVICDLDLQIPILLSNRAFFGSTMADVITDELGTKLPANEIAEFLDKPEFLYIQIENVPNPTFEWKNCFNEGQPGIASLIPIFNSQLASEKLSLLSFSENTRTINPISVDSPDLPLPSFTESSDISVAISGKDDRGLFLIDKYNKAVFLRTVVVQDGLTYPVLETLRFTIENTKADNYNISLTSRNPINENRIGDPVTIRICGLNSDLTQKTQC